MVSLFIVALNIYPFLLLFQFLPEDFSLAFYFCLPFYTEVCKLWKFKKKKHTFVIIFLKRHVLITFQKYPFLYLNFKNLVSLNPSNYSSLQYFN